MLWSFEHQCVQAESVRRGRVERHSATAIRERQIVRYQGTRMVNRQPANTGDWPREPR